MHRTPKTQYRSGSSECSARSMKGREKAFAPTWLQIRGTSCVQHYFRTAPQSEIQGMASTLGLPQSWDLRVMTIVESLQRRGSLLSVATETQSPTGQPSIG